MRPAPWEHGALRAPRSAPPAPRGATERDRAPVAATCVPRGPSVPPRRSRARSDGGLSAGGSGYLCSHDASHWAEWL